MLAVAVGLLIAGSGVQAQTKIGYIDAETILYLMPEVGKIDSVMQIYQRDTVGKEYMSLLQTYQYKDSIFRDSIHPAPAAVKDQIGKELGQLTQTLQNWQQIAQEAVQNKQSQLLAPVMKKIQDAIQAVAKEKGYTYIFNRESLLVGPPADNILSLVAEKLKVKVPPAGTQTQKPAPKTGN